MDTELLRTFLEVHRCGHFGQAADRLCVTPSAVSARIRLLEQQLGVELFERERNKIRLTAAGARLLPRAETVVALWERTRREMGVTRKPARLAVAAPPSLWETLLPDWLGWICHNAGVKLHLDTLSSEQVVQRLGVGLLDVGFLYDTPAISGIELREAGAVSMIMVSAAPTRGTADALDAGYVHVEWGPAFNARQLELTQGHEPTARVMTGQAALVLLRQCGGSAYLPEPLVAAQIAEGQLHPVPGAQTISIRAYAAFDAQGIHAPLVTRSLDALEAGA